MTNKCEVEYLWPAHSSEPWCSLSPLSFLQVSPRFDLCWVSVVFHSPKGELKKDAYVVGVAWLGCCLVGWLVGWSVGWFVEQESQRSGRISPNQNKQQETTWRGYAPVPPALSSPPPPPNRKRREECPVELKATIDRWNKRWPGDRDGRDRWGIWAWPWLHGGGLLAWGIWGGRVPGGFGGSVSLAGVGGGGWGLARLSSSGFCVGHLIGPACGYDEKGPVPLIGQSCLFKAGRMSNALLRIEVGKVLNCLMVIW